MLIAAGPCGGYDMRMFALTTAAAAASIFSGCMGQPPAGAAGPLPAFAHAATAREVAAHGKVVFIPNLSSSVTLYTADIHAHDPSPIGEITDGVSRSAAVWVDRRGTLYVLNSGGSAASVEEYERGASTPFKQITDGLFSPVSLAVDARRTLYVDDRDSSGNIVREYANGSLAPTKTISIPTTGRAALGQLAVDPKNDVFVGAFDVEHQIPYLFEIRAGASKAKAITLTDLPGDAIAFDGSGNLYACSQGGYINVYAPGATEPSHVMFARDEVLGGIAVTANGTVYVPSYTGVLYEFAPNATSPTNSFGIVSGAFGAAIGAL